MHKLFLTSEGFALKSLRFLKLSKLKLGHKAEMCRFLLQIAQGYERPTLQFDLLCLALEHKEHKLKASQRPTRELKSLNLSQNVIV